MLWLEKNRNFGIHSVTGNQELFRSIDLRPDQTHVHIFALAGAFDYYCKLDPTVTRKIVARRFKTVMDSTSSENHMIIFCFFLLEIASSIAFG